MIKTAWFNRKFPAIEDNGVLPSIIERLSGTPARLDEITAHIPAAALTRKPDDKWSIQEEIGHLSDLEPLWSGRLDDLIARQPELRATDLTNQATHNANHHATALTELLQRFREHRQQFVTRLWPLQDDQLNNTSLHPRLKTPMRIIDLAFFVAEHDDHHLSCIRELMKNKK